MIKIFLLLSFSLFAQTKHAVSTTPSIGVPTCCGGLRADSNNCDPGKPGTGFGAGGGSSGWAGGSGGAAYYLGGGGGGGVGGYGACSLIGGDGGMGAVVIQFMQGSSIGGVIVYAYSTSFTIRPEYDSIKFWAVGGGGAGGTALNNDGYSSSGAGAGAVASRTITGTGGKTLTITRGMGGQHNETFGSSGSNGGDTTVVYDPTGLNQTTIAGGGVGGRSNSGTNNAGGACSGTYDVCLTGGTGAGRSGDVDGTPGASIGASGSGGDGNNDDGNAAPNPVDTNGLFTALGLSRTVYLYANAGLSPISLTAKGAYSFRRIVSTYTGPSFRVRRSSDNLETDIGFNGDESDIGALKAFVGSSNGYLTTWYNQVGGLNAIQTTTAAQPRVALSGVPDLSPHSAILMMYLDGNTWLNTQIGAQDMTEAGDEGTTLIVARPFGGNSNAWSFGVANDAASNRWMAHFPYQGGQAYNAGEIYFDVGNLNTQRCHTGTTTPHDTWRVWSFVKRFDRSQVYWGTILGCTSQIVTGQRYTGNEAFHIGQNGGPTAPGQRFRGFMSEFVQYAGEVNATELGTYQNNTTAYYGLRL